MRFLCILSFFLGLLTIVEEHSKKDEHWAWIILAGGNNLVYGVQIYQKLVQELKNILLLKLNMIFKTKRYTELKIFMMNLNQF